jgi:predicted acyl esterase
MGGQAGLIGLDRPWHRQGAARYALARLPGLVRPPVEVYEPAPGQVIPVDIALGPSATLFRHGERLRLVIAGRWLWPVNPLTGQFPAAYQKSPKGRCTLHYGPQRHARLLIPVIP